VLPIDPLAVPQREDSGQQRDSLRDLLAAHGAPWAQQTNLDEIRKAENES